MFENASWINTSLAEERPERSDANRAPEPELGAEPDFNIRRIRRSASEGGERRMLLEELDAIQGAADSRPSENSMRACRMRTPRAE